MQIKNIKNKNIKWWLGFTSSVVLFSLLGIFAYMKFSFLLHGVKIEARIERDSTSALAHINGKAKHATIISLNGREIYIDKDGSFSEPLVLIPGFSVITIETQDKFGNDKTKKFQVVYEEGSPSVAFNSK